MEIEPWASHFLGRRSITICICGFFGNISGLVVSKPLYALDVASLFVAKPPDLRLWAPLFCKQIV